MRELITIYLPWPISVITITQLWLTGNKHRNAWLLSLFNQALWSLWIVCSGSWGLIPMNLAFWSLAMRNHYKWKREGKRLIARRWPPIRPKKPRRAIVTIVTGTSPVGPIEWMKLPEAVELKFVPSDAHQTRDKASTQLKAKTAK